jgi:hypothetical protein
MTRPLLARCLPYSVLLLLLAAMPACGPSGPRPVPVSGTVTVDGQPMAGASVMFMPQSEGRPGVGVTDEAGKFRLTSGSSQEGVLPGPYKVTVTLHKVTGFVTDKDGLSGGIAPGGIHEQWLVPQRYSRPQTSGLTAEVRDGMEPVKLALTAK